MQTVFQGVWQKSFEEQRDSRAWVCCVHWKLFGSDMLLINHVDLSSSYLNKAFFLACRDVLIPRQKVLVLLVLTVRAQVSQRHEG